MSDICLFCLKQETAINGGLCTSCISENNICTIICLICSKIKICIFDGICDNCATS